MIDLLLRLTRGGLLFQDALVGRGDSREANEQMRGSGLRRSSPRPRRRAREACHLPSRRRGKAVDLLLLRLTPRGMTGAVSAPLPVRQGRESAAALPFLTTSGEERQPRLGSLLRRSSPVPSQRLAIKALGRVHHQIVTGPRRVRRWP